MLFVQVVKLRCAGKHAVDMKALAASLEQRTGGVVVHRSGGTVFLWSGEVPVERGARGGGESKGVGEDVIQDAEDEGLCVPASGIAQLANKPVP